MFALNRLRPLLRVTLRALLLLTTLSNPILATVGDLHDTFGVIDKVHPGAISTSTAASAVGAEEHDEGPMDLFHALIHGAHCCGHLIAILQITVALIRCLRPRLPRSMLTRCRSLMVTHSS